MDVGRPRTRVTAQLWSHVRRPMDPVESTRWLFLCLALFSLLLTVPVAMTNDDPNLRLLALASTVVLASSWLVGYVRHGASWPSDIVDALAALGFAIACHPPVIAFAFLFPAIWWRSFYGSRKDSVLRTGLLVVSLTAAAFTWPALPGQTGDLDLLLGLPLLLANVVIGGFLADNLWEREQTARREEVHLTAGSELLGVLDTVEVRRIAWQALTSICGVTPGLRVIRVVKDGPDLVIAGATGGFAELPTRLGPSLLATLHDTIEMVPTPLPGSRRLDEIVGTPCIWLGLRLAVVHARPETAWILLGQPRAVSPNAIASVVRLSQQVTLALRTSGVHEELSIQANLDSLTGLANRPAFAAVLSEALAEAAPAEEKTVLFIDLDDFKDVNDSFGHRGGDELLREIAARLRRTTRPDDLCARLGGDEFAVLLRGASTERATEVAQRIVQAISAPVRIQGRTTVVRASVGLASANGSTDFEGLIHGADVAMYAAKAGGKARIQIFEPGLLTGNSGQAAFEREISSAASKGQLVVHYQPILSLPDRRCFAVEALVRWQHPERGLLFPDSFIEAAERTGAIGSIGAHVLLQACTDAATWRTEHPGSPVGVHVNVSALQLDDNDFIDSVTHCLRDFGLRPEQLVLEITETVVISSPDAIQRLNALAALGVTIAIDDFGTGYSALTTLRTLPVRIVKIDKSFVAGSTLNPEDRAVTEAVVKMAAQMGLRTVAEGVERPEQEMFLRSIAADAVQGFLYARPTSAADFAEWFREHLEGLSALEPTQHMVLPFKARSSGLGR